VEPSVATAAETAVLPQLAVALEAIPAGTPLEYVDSAVDHDARRAARMEVVNLGHLRLLGGEVE